MTTVSYSYQWLRGETAAAAGQRDRGRDERDLHGWWRRTRASTCVCGVNFQDDDGNDETASSDATGPVSAEPNVAATGQPTISGTAQVGEDLSAGTSGISDENGLATVSYELPVAAR